MPSASEGRFRVHLDAGPEDFGSAEEALAALEAVLGSEARAAAGAAGAEDIHVHLERDIRMAEVEGQQVFVEAALTAEASGRPRVAEG